MRQLFLLQIFMLLLSITTLTAQKTDDDIAENQLPQQTIIVDTKTAINNSSQNSLRSPSIPAPTTTGATLCGPGTANLTATALNGGILEWYNVATGGTSVATGTTYNPVVTSTTNFWVQEVVGGSGTGTTFATVNNTNNGQRGAMFDITATNAITITSFDACLYVGTTANYEIYYRPSSHVGFENSSAGWTLLGSATGVTSAGSNLPTPLPIPFSVAIPAGQTYSFYVTNDFGGGLSYTDGTALGAVWGSNADMTIYEGVGKSYPFGLTFTVRKFNGRVHYSTGGAPTISPRALTTATVRTPAYAVTATTTTSNASCTVNESGVDWTYYYNTANPNNLLFAIAHDPLNLGQNSFTANVAVTVNNNSTTTGYYTQSNAGQKLARFVMGRYWNVNMVSGTLVSPVWVRYYYQPAEKTAMLNARTTWQGMNGGDSSPMYFFKTNGTPFNPATDLHSSGVYNGIELNNYTDNQNSLNGINYVEIHDVASFSGGSLITGVVPSGGSTDGTAILLDLKLLNFVAQKNETSTTLRWTTENEENGSYFIMERSLDGVNFVEMATVSAQNGKEQNHYQWEDVQPYSATNYYRIKMLDATGSYSYSAVKAISFDNNDNTISIYPNPFKEQLTIDILLSQQEAIVITIFNNLGQVVYTKAAELESGRQVIELPFSSTLSAGCYVVHIKGQSQSIQRKVVKQ